MPKTLNKQPLAVNKTNTHTHKKKKKYHCLEHPRVVKQIKMEETTMKKRLQFVEISWLSSNFL